MLRFCLHFTDDPPHVVCGKCGAALYPLRLFLDCEKHAGVLLLTQYLGLHWGYGHTWPYPFLIWVTIKYVDMTSKSSLKYHLFFLLGIIIVGITATYLLLMTTLGASLHEAASVGQAVSILVTSQNTTITHTFLSGVWNVLGGGVQLFLFLAAVWYLYTHRVTSWSAYRTSVLFGLLMVSVIILEGSNGLFAWGTLFHVTSVAGYLLSFLSYVTMATILFVIPTAVYVVAGKSLRMESSAAARGVIVDVDYTGLWTAITRAASRGYLIGGLALLAAGVAAFASVGTTGSSSKDLAYVLGTNFPSFTVFSTVAFLPAVAEEVTFRFFAIMFFARLTKSRLMSAVLATIMWVVPHVNSLGIFSLYQIIYFSFVGSLLTYAFLRYDLLTSVIVHYVLNAVVGAVLLWMVFSDSRTVMWSTLVVVLLPALIGVGAYSIKLSKLAPVL